MKKYLTKEDLYFDTKKILEEAGYKVNEYTLINYGLQFKVSGETIRIFQSKKKGVSLDLSPLKNEKIKDVLNSSFVLGRNENKGAINSQDTLTEILPPPLAGSDEAGKGDYFAPLVVCCIYANEREYNLFKEIGVKDSKDLADEKIIKLAKEIKAITSNYEIIKISSKKYNELYEKMQNINKILAWAHSSAIKNVYKKIPFEKALIDKFGREEMISSSLKELNLALTFETKGERNKAVAAASILARNVLLEEMKKQEERYNMAFPLGSSSFVVSKGKEFVERFSPKELENVGKLHFKTTNDILDK